MIRKAIKEALTLRKIKAINLAEHVGVTKSTMSLFLNGKMNLGQDKIETIFKHLEIDLVIKQ